jgi:hypothetical protein
VDGALEAASLPAAPSALESTEPIAGRLALGIVAGLIAVLVHGEADRLSGQELTWRALLRP